MARTVYRVLPAQGRWELRRESTSLRFFEVKADAVASGQTTAKANQPSQLLVHKADGTIEFEYTYGDDPYPPKG